MALAPAAYVLWTRFLRHNPADPDWVDRDRFVLSCGHASMLLYALLHLTGYDLALEELKAFRQWGSRTPGHPERGHTPGVETTTGPLGQGFANAVGMAIAERFLAEHFNRPGHRVVDHRIWVFASDGDLMEGVASEAASLAGHLRLGKLTVALRRQSHHHRRRHRAHLLGRRAAPVRGLRLARCPGWRRQRPRRHRGRARGRARRDRQADAGDPADVHRRSGADQAQLRRGPWRPTRRRGGPADQGDHGLADGAGVLRARRRAGALARRARSWRRAPGGVGRALEGLRRRSRRSGGGVPALDVGLASRRAGIGACPASRPAAARWRRGRRRGSRSRRSRPRSPTSSAGRPTWAAAPGRRSSRAGRSDRPPRAASSTGACASTAWLRS